MLLPAGCHGWALCLSVLSSSPRLRLIRSCAAAVQCRCSSVCTAASQKPKVAAASGGAGGRGPRAGAGIFCAGREEGGAGAGRVTCERAGQNGPAFGPPILKEEEVVVQQRRWASGGRLVSSQEEALEAGRKRWWAGRARTTGRFCPLFMALYMYTMIVPCTLHVTERRIFEEKNNILYFKMLSCFLI